MRFAARDRDELAEESRTACKKGDDKTAQRGMLRQNERELRHEVIAKAVAFDNALRILETRHRSSVMQSRREQNGGRAPYPRQ